MSRIYGIREAGEPAGAIIAGQTEISGVSFGSVDANKRLIATRDQKDQKYGYTYQTLT